MNEIVEPLVGGRRRGRIRTASADVVRDYVTLTKPRIMALLVLTSVCAMVAAAGGSPAPVALAALGGQEPHHSLAHGEPDGPGHRSPPGDVSRGSIPWSGQVSLIQPSAGSSQASQARSPGPAITFR